MTPNCSSYGTTACWSYALKRAVSRPPICNHGPLTLTVPCLRAKQSAMMRPFHVLVLLLCGAVALSACASRSEIEAGRLAKEQAAQAEDDATCRSTNAKPGEPAYEACRQELATKRAARAEIDYQKAREFDRVLGGLNEF